MGAGFNEDELRFVQEAVEGLESPSFLVRTTNFLGKPIEKGMERLPARAKAIVESTSRRAIEGAFKAALQSLATVDRVERPFGEAITASKRSEYLHTAGAVLTGAVGGLFGLPAILAELPVTTTIMLRSIANTAAELGEDISSREIQMECLYIFSMGGPSAKDDEMESAYYTTRLAMGELVHRAMGFVAGRTAQEIARAVQGKSAPALIELIVRIASRFELVVSEKAMGQLIPGIGAGAGALINGAFSDHFSAIARYHFGLKRLEREHGKGAVEELYREVRQKLLDRKKT